jgi:hypothetical protein
MLAILGECRAQLGGEDASSNPALAAALSEARASMLFSLHSKRSTASAAASTAAKAYFWGIQEPQSDAEREAAAIERVDAAAMAMAFDRYFLPLLSQGQRCTCVCVPAGKDKQIAASLEKVLGLKGRQVRVLSLPQIMIPITP